MTHDLSGKTALVTGASRGLGAAMAVKLAACGARTAINYFGHPQKAQQIVEIIRKAGGAAEAFQADVRDETAVNDLVEQVRTKYGPIDILVANATGPQPFIKLEELTWRDCLDMLEFFVKSPVLLAKAVIGPMKERRRGRIIRHRLGSLRPRRPRVLQLCVREGRAVGPDRARGRWSWPPGGLRSTSWRQVGYRRSATPTIHKTSRTPMRRRCR